MHIKLRRFASVSWSIFGGFPRWPKFVNIVASSQCQRTSLVLILTESHKEGNLESFVCPLSSIVDA